MVHLNHTQPRATLVGESWKMQEASCCTPGSVIYCQSFDNRTSTPDNSNKGCSGMRWYGMYTNVRFWFRISAKGVRYSCQIQASRYPPCVTQQQDVKVLNGSSICNGDFRTSGIFCMHCNWSRAVRSSTLNKMELWGFKLLQSPVAWPLEASKF